MVNVLFSKTNDDPKIYYVSSTVIYMLYVVLVILPLAVMKVSWWSNFRKSEFIWLAVQKSSPSWWGSAGSRILCRRSHCSCSQETEDNKCSCSAHFILYVFGTSLRVVTLPQIISHTGNFSKHHQRLGSRLFEILSSKNVSHHICYT